MHMSSLANHPILTFTFLFLLLLYIQVSRFANGTQISPKNTDSFTKKADVLLIDIRTSDRFRSHHIEGVIHDPNPLNFKTHKTKSFNKVVFFHDSNIILNRYQMLAGIKKAPTNIYHVYMPDYQTYAGKRNKTHKLVGFIPDKVVDFSGHIFFYVNNELKPELGL